jgi:hypothetical protein
MMEARRVKMIERQSMTLLQAILSRQRAETLSSVLYPDDRTYQGKELRLKQQHFFVSATIQVRQLWTSHSAQGSASGLCCFIWHRNELFCSSTSALHPEIGLLAALWPQNDLRLTPCSCDKAEHVSVRRHPSDSVH